MAVHCRTCPFCEATCGLRVETEGDQVVSIRGDEEDVLSHGFICPKAYGLKELHEDPDRLTAPLIRRDGELVEGTWEEAFEEIDRRLPPILEQHGRNAAAVYLGNPNAHNLSTMTYGPVWLRALGSQNIYSASTVDQMPKQVSAGLMFGTILSIPVPDVDRSDHLLILGANPLVSNGSLLTAPDMRGRIRRLRERGGKVVVVDPRRSRTAEAADEHHFVRPGTDAHLLLGIAATLVEEELDSPGALAEHCNGLDEVRELVREFPAERVAPVCGIEPEEIRRMAREVAAAERAAVYARIGTTTQEFGTLASWLVDVLNVLTGNLDREGGAIFTLAAAAQKNASGKPGVGKGVRLGPLAQPRARASRGLRRAARGLPGRGDRYAGRGPGPALITVAGNPVVSTPNASRLGSAIESLEFMLAVDIYVNETTRHADVILPRSGAAPEVALRPRAVPAGRPRRGQFLSCGLPLRRRQAGRVGDVPADRGDRVRPGAGRGRRRPRRARGADARAAGDAGARPRGGAGGARSAPRPRADPRPPPPRRSARAHPRRPRGQPPRRRSRPAPCRGSPRCCAPRRGRSSSRRSRSWPIWTGSGPRSTGGTAGWC